ncbi:MAG: sugar ABC transporter substrate-binding protein, partial [Salana multivorans]|nr:sugar ABC transporter substrate-binding protein [Salana multivorans]
MRTIRTTGLAAAAALAVLLAACSTGGGGEGSTSGGSGDGTDTGSGEAAGLIGEDQMVGAMTDYGVGTTFKATEPVDFGLLYRDHPNYPVKNDWLVLSEIEAN